MSAFKSGGTASRLRAKNSAMAAAMKAAGVARHVFRCPICHNLVSLAHGYHHIVVCKGRR